MSFNRGSIYDVPWRDVACRDGVYMQIWPVLSIQKSSEFQQQQQQRASGVKYIESQDITLSASRHGISDTTKFQPKRFHPLREPNNPFRPNSVISFK